MYVKRIKGVKIIGIKNLTMQLGYVINVLFSQFS